MARWHLERCGELRMPNGAGSISLSPSFSLSVRNSELVLNSTGDRNTAISSARSILKREEDVLAVVSFLGNSKEKRSSSFRSRMPKTLTDLPDELIAHILDLSEPSLNDLIRILQV